MTTNVDQNHATNQLYAREISTKTSSKNMYTTKRRDQRRRFTNGQVRRYTSPKTSHTENGHEIKGKPKRDRMGI